MLWYRKHGKNYDWYLRMQAKGTNVTQLSDEPHLLAVESLYLHMYSVCSNRFQDIKDFCELYCMSTEEIIESLNIIHHIHNKVGDASNTT